MSSKRIKKNRGYHCFGNRMPSKRIDAFHQFIVTNTIVLHRSRHISCYIYQTTSSKRIKKNRPSFHFSQHTLHITSHKHSHFTSRNTLHEACFMVTFYSILLQCRRPPLCNGVRSHHGAVCSFYGTVSHNFTHNHVLWSHSQTFHSNVATHCVVLIPPSSMFYGHI